MPKKHNALSRSDNAETSRPTSGPSYWLFKSEL